MDINIHIRVDTGPSLLMDDTRYDGIFVAFVLVGTAWTWKQRGALRALVLDGPSAINSVGTAAGLAFLLITLTFAVYAGQKAFL
jgi:hypothetical protein